MDKHLIRLEQPLHVRRVEVFDGIGYVGAFQYAVKPNFNTIGDLIFRQHRTILGHDDLSKDTRYFLLKHLGNKDGRHAFTVDSFDSMLYDIHYMNKQLESYDITNIKDIAFVNDYLINAGSTVIVIDNQVFFLIQDAQQVASIPFTFYKDNMLCIKKIITVTRLLLTKLQSSLSAAKKLQSSVCS